jgi:hypothetical protein
MDRASVARIAGTSLLFLGLGLALGNSGCSSPSTSNVSGTKPLAEPVAAALADSFRSVLVQHFEVPATSQKDVYAIPAHRDSVAGYVVRISVPYEMVSKHTIPHEWLREQLLEHDWTILMAADAHDGASYRALRGPALITVEATWEDTQPPANLPDWYAMTVGIPSVASGR